MELTDIPAPMSGIRRYAMDVKRSLAALGVEFVDRGADFKHAVMPSRRRVQVVTCHHLKPLTFDQGSLYGRYFGFKVSQSFQSASAIIANSSQTAAEINSLYPQHANKVRTINLGIDARFHPSDRREGSLKIGYRWKSLEMIRPALNQAGVQFQSTELSGAIPDDALPDFYQSLDYYVDFRPYAGFGLPHLEARACGATVFVPKQVVMPSEVKRFCVLTTPDECAKMIQSGFKQPYEKIPFTLEEMARKTLSIYEEVVASPRS